MSERSRTVRLNASSASDRLYSAEPDIVAEPGVGTMMSASGSRSVQFDITSELSMRRSICSGSSTS